jgi:predicted DNA-binding transcriptional regulator AlpA
MSNSDHIATAATAVITTKTAPSAGAASPGAVPPLLLDVRATARALGIPQKTVGTWNRTGRLPMPIRMGRRSLFWKADELADWVRRDCPPRQRWENMKGTRR